MINKEILDSVLVGTQILILLCLIAFLFKTWRMTSSIKSAFDVISLQGQTAKEITEQEHAPYIVVFFHYSTEEQAVSVVIKNIGRSMAKNVQIKFNPPLLHHSGEDVGETPLLKNGIKFLFPNQEVRLPLDSKADFYYTQNEKKTLYEVSISFFGGILETQRISEQLLDPAVDLQSIRHAQNDAVDVPHEMQKISRGIERISTELSALVEIVSSGHPLKNILAPASVQTEQDSWQSIVITRLLEFNYLWSSLYGGKRDKLAQPFLGKIKNRLSQITNQLLATTALSPVEAKDEFRNQVLDIIAKMADLNTMHISLDDPQSIVLFNTSGDKIRISIEGLVAKNSDTAKVS